MFPKLFEIGLVLLAGWFLACGYQQWKRRVELNAERRVRHQLAADNRTALEKASFDDLLTEAAKRSEIMRTKKGGEA